MIRTFLETLSFKPDDFQLNAMEAITAGHSVVVSSPTGSGKTLIAEFAAYAALKGGRKLFYTTPLKALSNQKFEDFKRVYGDDAVGLLTGDTSINRDAQIVVMTTEVFRNMLYGVQEDSRLLRDVESIVLDECHYMNDSQRGTVWEESIIYCPESIQIIALSATVANAAELTDWINEIHHDTTLVSTDFRPVPLRFFYFTRQDLLPLYKAGTTQLNSKLKFDNQGKHLPKQLRAFDANALTMELHTRQMLPAIFFTFSRKGCDKYLFETRQLDLLTPEEKKRLRKEIDAYVEAHPFLAENKHLRPMANGFASHHAGLLPALKGLVEVLFQKGLIKVVFATETLAAGINMPARTTVITAISKRTNDGHRILTASEFLQMSGRAGRRGMDDVGYVVTVSTQFESAHDVALLASSLADPLNSQFTPTYGMVINLLQKHTLEEAKFLISKSFGSFTAERRVRPLKKEIAILSDQLREALHFDCPYGLTEQEFQTYLKNKDILKETQKQVKIYRNQLKRHGQDAQMKAVLNDADAQRVVLTDAVQGEPCYTCEVYKQHLQRDERIERLQKQLRQINKQYAEESDLYWHRFKNHYSLLKEVGFLDADDRPTTPGKLMGQLRTENEFYLAQILLNGLVDDLTPSQLAAVMCAVTNDSNRENIFSQLRMSRPARQATYNIQKISKRLHQLQSRYRLDTPMTMNPVASGPIEAWADGMAWSRLVQASSMEEGDLVRIIRRTADILRQMTRTDGLSSKLSDTAAIALKALYRDPVKELEALPNKTDKKAQSDPEADNDLERFDTQALLTQPLGESEA